MYMKYRRILAAMTAVALMASACSCGKEEKETPEDKGSSTVQDVTSKTDRGDEKEKTTKKKNDDNTSEKATEKLGESTTTTKAGEKKTDAAVTTAANSSTSNTITAANNNSNDNDNNNGDSGSSNGGDSSGEGDNTTEEKVYTAEIELGVLPKVKGTNVSVSGSTVTINAGGDFRFYGSVSDGQICVSTATEEKVTVVLDGVDISNSSGPAIFINEAKRCTIKSREGTVNYLSDGGNDKINDGVIFSNDTVRLKGKWWDNCFFGPFWSPFELRNGTILR